MTQQADVPFGNYQYEIYLGGLAGEVPELPVTYEGLEARAKERLEPGPYGYVAGGAGSEATVRANRDAFERRRLVPRMLRDVGERELGTEVLGTPMPAPVLLAPIGVQSIVHADAELAVARAAAEVALPFILSTAASKPMEEVAEAAGEGRRWYQLYWPNDRELAASLLRRAEAAGYEALVVTLDTWLLAWRPRDLAGAYLPFLKGEGIANYLSDPVFRSKLEKSPEDDMQAAVGLWVQSFSDPTVTWDELAFLRDSTSLPIVLKGILHPDDARLAVDHGMDGVIVSNHGGRQVDGAVAALDALPGVRAAVPDGFPVLMDGGIRGGSDVVKAVALGADAVLLGRPWVWGLALGGEQGVAHVLKSVLAELDLTLALTGHRRIAEVGPEALA